MTQVSNITLKHKTLRRGFTLIELMLAMTFVSMLLLAISMTIIQVGNMYSRGMVLKDINQSSRTISDDIRRTVSAAGSISLDASNYVTSSSGTVPVSGRLCLGNYSYVWNTIDAQGKAEAIKLSSAAGAPLVSMVKVSDSSGVYCARTSGGALVVGSSIRSADSSSAVELLNKGDHSLSIAAFSVESSGLASDPSTGQRLFNINYSIGTGSPGAMNASRGACLPRNNPNADPLYCNVQQFNLIVRSGGGI